VTILSHITVYTTKIGQVSASIVTNAITKLAQELKAETITRINNYYGQPADKVLIGLRTHDCPNGIGVNVDSKGNMTFIGDPYNQQYGWDNLKTLATNTVKAYKVAATARLQYPAAKINIRTNQENKEIQLEVCI